MSWNCLCSKEKKRPQISAPILNTDEQQKLKLLPNTKAQHQQLKVITTEHLERKLIPPTDGITSHRDINSNRTTANNNNQRKGQNVRLLGRATAGRTTRIQPRDADDGALTRHLATVKFSFEDETVKKSTVPLNDHENGNYDELPLIQLEDLQPRGVQQFPRSTESFPFVDEEQQPSKSERRTNFHDERFITLQARNVGTLGQKIPHPVAPKEEKFDKSAQLLYQPDKVVIHQFVRVEILQGTLCQVCHSVLKAKTSIRCVSCNLICHEYCSDKPMTRYTDTTLLIHDEWNRGHEKVAFPTVYAFLYRRGAGEVDDGETSDLHPNGMLQQQQEEKFMRIRGQKVGYKYNNRDIRRPNGLSRKRRSREIAEKRSSRKSVELRIVENDGEQETPLVIVEPQSKPQETQEVAEDQQSATVSKDPQENISKDEDQKPNEEPEDSGEKVQVQISADVHSVPATDINENTVLEDTKKEIVQDITNIEEPEITENQETKEQVSEDKPQEKNPDSTSEESAHKSPVPEPASEPDEILAIVEPLDDVCEIRVKAKDADGGSPQSLRHISRTSSTSSRSGARSPIPGTVIGVPIRRKQYTSISETSFDDPTSSSYDESDEPDYAKVEQRGKNHESQPIIPKSQSFPTTLQPKKSSAISQATETLRLHYVTERILASVLPPRTSSVDQLARPHSENSVAGFEEDEYERELITMLEQKHNKNYQMFDLESCIATISLEKLCELCKHIDAWLGGGREKVVVLQDRGDRQRLGAAIAAYLEYQKICGSNFPSRSLSEDQRIARKWLDLDIYSMQKFLEDVVGPLRVPSHRRYLQYFSGLLSGGIRMNSSPLYLKYVSLESPPSWLHYSSFASQNAEWRCFIKVYEGLKCVFTSDIHVIPFATRQFIFQVGHLRLRGDIILRCYQIIPQEQQPSVRELMFSTQFHTCAIGNKELTFLRHDLDFACDDPRFPADHKVILHFNSGSPAENRGFVFQSPLVRIEPANTLAHTDSLENINEAASKHLQGPLDGSLYATILKSPKSPQHSPPQLSLPSTPAKPIRTSSQQNLISPPPEFSSPKIIVSAHNSSSSTVRNSTPVPRKDPVQTIPRAYSQPPVRKPGTPQPPERHSSTHVVHNYPPNQTQIRVIEEYRYKTQDNTANGNVPSSSRTQTTEHDGRESVRSPLTLSMDSGISSSGIVNRRVQGSSVSPSSFPSQASPQDRHRELDDILSDMLMTVQDIPDISANNSVSQQGRVKRSTQVPYSTATVKRSPSANRPSDIVTKAPSGVDQYDTASTATTLTPPPSESGRETPIIGGTDKRSVDLETRSDSALVMNLQSQSFAYPQPQHTVELISVTSDEDSENIPYHAREDSRPFTYGNVQGPQQPPASVMLKMQSGLSSPSLVRKQLNQQGHRKTPIRNDFEEMLRERREKVSGEKYSISDRTPNGSSTLRSYHTTSTGPGSYTTEQRWYSNGYHHEPLKRSNTMDGGFGRSTSSEGLTGQSWLQLQQQKLRARNEQKMRDERDVFERRIHTEITGRPYRSRSSASKRYDGYTSDTTFADEVDYRRPLHVQTPTRSLNDRNYHTLTTTTTTVKERPFVAVRRAHDQAKQQTISSSNSPLSVLSAAPHGHIAQVSPQASQTRQEEQKQQNGLLSLANDSASRSNGHARLESEGRLSGSTSSSPTSSTTNPSSGDNQEIGQMTLNELLEKLTCDAKEIERLQDQRKNKGDPLENDFTATVKRKPVNSHTLTDVIADLTDFTNNHTKKRNNRIPNEGMMNGHGRVGLTNGSESPAIRKINSESENSSSVSPSLSERSNGVSWSDQVREESISSYNDDFSPIGGSPRPETPAFPVTPRTPYSFGVNGNTSPALPPKSPTSQRKDLYSGHQVHHLVNQNDSVSCYTSRRNSTTSTANSEPQEVAPHHVKFVRDSSKYWYKPNISREQAANLLRDAPPGTFIVRDSKSFANAFGLVLKVAYPPPHVAKGGSGDELVRHFLVEPTTRGVRLKGCANEPVFTSLSALVYQHSITPLALPCRLIIPDRDIQHSEYPSPAQQQLLLHGAACNVLFLCSVETESLTGPEAVRKAVTLLFSRRPLPSPTKVHFKVTNQGITLTDNTRQLFFSLFGRTVLNVYENVIKHYPSTSISHCSLDPDERRWSVPASGDIPVVNNRIFAFVARRSSSSMDNVCHIFCELEPTQPATAITSFANQAIFGGVASQPALSRAI
ncbi:tensin-1 isoform X6 [Phlebotomus papatasi]|uniref:tensin-1 isoform X6 n=1 Tax=Phlebotomus papatasi TaxID=29031 RepID=UPI0024844103|nr:tensin-1 isoform X6 [Phlebotomus papatasi]